jgi:hypothetical protein
MQKNVEFHSRIKRRQRFVHNFERRTLRRNQTAETDQDRNEPYDWGEAHSHSFDFTLGTA